MCIMRAVVFSRSSISFSPAAPWSWAKGPAGGKWLSGAASCALRGERSSATPKTSSKNFPAVSKEVNGNDFGSGCGRIDTRIYPTLVSVCFVHDLPPAGKASAFSQIAGLKNTPAVESRRQRHVTRFAYSAQAFAPPVLRACANHCFCWQTHGRGIAILGKCVCVTPLPGNP